MILLKTLPFSGMFASIENTNFQGFVFVSLFIDMIIHTVQTFLATFILFMQQPVHDYAQKQGSTS